MEEAKKIRAQSKRKFTRLENNIIKNIQDKTLPTFVERRFNEISQQWEIVQEEHDKLTSLCANEEEVEIADEWLTVVSDSFYALEIEVHDYLKESKDAAEPPEQPAEKKRSKDMKLDFKMKFQPFNGDIRKFAKFKEEFTKYIHPKCSTGEVAFVLKSYLVEEVRDDVDNVDEDLAAIWERLDTRYGNTGRLVDTILADIKNIPSCNNDDNTLYLISTVEKAYRDLQRMTLEHEINNSTIVAMIERKLPSEITKEWIKLMAKSKTPHVNKFPQLFELLKECRSRIEYQISDIRTGVISGDASHVSGGTVQPANQKCWIHTESNTHPIWQCNEFISKSSQEKVELVKRNNACVACLDNGHLVKDCKRGFKCRIEQCQKDHNDLLHEAHKAGIVFHSRAETGNATTNSILQLQIIAGSKNMLDSRKRPMNVLWDSASNLSFTTSRKAKELGLVGKPVTLSMTTVGGVKKVQQTIQYKLTLIDENSKRVEIDVIGLDKISNNITKIDLEPFLKLFNTIKGSAISRPENGEVDVLIGYDYAGYHPVRIQASGHLMVLTNRFGSIIAGNKRKIKHSRLVETWESTQRIGRR